MSNTEVGSLIFLLLVFVASAHLLGHLFARLRQPRVVGEILAGVILGPSVIGRFADVPAISRFLELTHKHAPVLDFIYWLGLLLLMFISGAETRRLFSRDDRRQVTWLATVGTGLPFVIALLLTPILPLGTMMGAAGNRASLIIVFGIAVAVTSIPVISRIFADLKILNTRFARLVLGVAVIEDIVLWAALAIATALVGTQKMSTGQIALHVVGTLVFFGIGLTLAPAFVKRVNKTRFNFLAQGSPIGYVVAVLFAYCALAGAMDVSLVFAAFLAGFAVVSNKRNRFPEALDSISRFSFAIFIPIYFLIVGLKLNLTKSFSFGLLAAFLVGACVIKLVSVAAGARLAGFRGLDVLNLAITTNARGGPGIVLASVAFDAGIINAAFYTTLVLVAVLTSQLAGAWLEFVLRKGWPLLSAAPIAAAPEKEVASSQLPVAS